MITGVAAVIPVYCEAFAIGRKMNVMVRKNAGIGVPSIVDVGHKLPASISAVAASWPHFDQDEIEAASWVLVSGKVLLDGRGRPVV